MTEAGNRAVEHAEAMVALERDTAIARVRGALAERGRARCADCREPIDPRRRRVLPSARRCGGCQARHELKNRRGW